MNIAVILAGGVGKRMGSDLPKQFLKFGKKTCLEHTVLRFIRAKNIDKIIIVIHPSWMKFAAELTESFSSACIIIPAGDNRSQSSYNALNFIDKHFQCKNVLIHDAVRPFVSEKLIDSCLVELENYVAVTVSVPVTETIIESDGEFIKRVPDRGMLFINQTPQAFRFQNIKQAYDFAYNENHRLEGYSDDCMIFQRYSSKNMIKIIPGEYKNIKLTTPIDLQLFEMLAQ